MKTRPAAVPVRVCLLVFLLGVGSGAAWALVPGAGVSCDADDECNSLANQAMDHSDAGRYAAAHRAYKEAYARRPDPKLLFNLARMLHKDGRLAEAVTYYQKYLDAGAEGKAEQRVKAQQRLDEARREQTLVTTGKPGTESSQAVPVYRKWWLWTIVGVAAAGAAVGIALGVAAQRPDLTGYTDVNLSGN